MLAAACSWRLSSSSSIGIGALWPTGIARFSGHAPTFCSCGAAVLPQAEASCALFPRVPMAGRLPVPAAIFQHPSLVLFCLPPALTTTCRHRHHTTILFRCCAGKHLVLPLLSPLLHLEHCPPNFLHPQQQSMCTHTDACCHRRGSRQGGISRQETWSERAGSREQKRGGANVQGSMKAKTATDVKKSGHGESREQSKAVYAQNSSRHGCKGLLTG